MPRHVAFQTNHAAMCLRPDEVYFHAGLFHKS
jgi:hypothetical protein